MLFGKKVFGCPQFWLHVIVGTTFLMRIYKKGTKLDMARNKNRILSARMMRGILTQAYSF